MSVSVVSSYDWHTTPDKWREPRVFYDDFASKYEERIKISHVVIDKKITDEKKNDINYSPNKAYWFIVYTPDTMKPSPWSTEIEVFNERDYLIKIELIDHAATYMTTTKWINDKLLYIEFWWGRVLGTYLIFDVEKEKIIIREMVKDGGIAFQQWQQNKQKWRTLQHINQGDGE